MRSLDQSLEFSPKAVTCRKESGRTQHTSEKDNNGLQQKTPGFLAPVRPGRKALLSAEGP